MESGGHTPEEPSREHKQEENERERGRGGDEGGLGGIRHDEVSATAWSVLSAVGQLSALLSSLGFMSDTIYLAVKPRQPSHPHPPHRPPRPRSLSSSLSPSITNSLSTALSLALSISLVAVQRRPPLCPLILLAKSLNGLQHALFSDFKVCSFKP